MPNQTVCKERILSEDYMDFIINYQNPDFTNEVPILQQCVQRGGFGYETIYLSRADAMPLRLENYPYNSIPKCYGLLDMEALNQAGITQIQNYPTLQLKGENVMIGFIDTGIDYQNQVFRHLDGSTRIAGIWDQTIQKGVPPQGLFYGSEYSTEKINEALQSDISKEEVPTMDENGHGTFLASVAAGSANVDARFLGAAPESTIGVVKLKQAKQYLKDFYFIKESAIAYQENDIIMGIHYLDTLAQAKNMPLVICIALGTNLGGHTASSPLGIVLDRMANARNRVVVIGGGNEANQRHHYSNEISSTKERKEMEIRVGSQEQGFTLEIWADIPNLFAVSIVSPSGEKIPRIPIKQNSSAVYSFVFEQTQVYVDYRLLVQKTNSQLIYFRFARPTAGIWKIVMEPVQLSDGIFHAWLPMKEFQKGEIYFIESNPYYTITEPSSSISPITVACENGNENSIDINSGRGYTRNRGVKPDFAAPGVSVTGAVPGGRFTERTGSSVAVGIAGGACALMLEWVVYQLGNSGVDSVQIKNLLILGAIRKPNEPYPNREWGYGSMNLYHTFEVLRTY
ncbi:MAG: S8 family peptidase [Lachnospiraceae bacterium]